MYKVLKFDGEKKKNYKLYYRLNIILYIAFVILLLLTLYKKEFSILLGIFFFLWFILNVVITRVFKNNLNFNVFVLNQQTNEFYKIGIYPNSAGCMASDENFIKDKHFLYDYFSSFISPAFYGYHNDNGWCSNLRILEALIKLNDDKYILKQINNIHFVDMCYKITKIYSYEYKEDINSYSIICDGIETNSERKYEKITLYINKRFDPNNEIKNYIEKVCTNEVITENQLYEQSQTYKERKKNLRFHQIMSVIMIILVMIILMILVSLGKGA